MGSQMKPVALCCYLPCGAAASTNLPPRVEDWAPAVLKTGRLLLLFPAWDNTFPRQAPQSGGVQVRDPS
jgi:hypothetical protein